MPVDFHRSAVPTHEEKFVLAISNAKNEKRLMALTLRAEKEEGQGCLTRCWMPF